MIIIDSPQSIVIHWHSNVINHPPLITILMGGIPTIKNKGGANDIDIPTWSHMIEHDYYPTGNPSRCQQKFQKMWRSELSKQILLPPLRFIPSSGWPRYHPPPLPHQRVWSPQGWPHGLSLGAPAAEKPWRTPAIEKIQRLEALIRQPSVHFLGLHWILSVFIYLIWVDHSWSI